MNKKVTEGFFASKMFYFSVSFIILLILFKYNNFMSIALFKGNPIYSIILIVLSITSSYYYLTIGRNPGIAQINTLRGIKLKEEQLDVEDFVKKEESINLVSENISNDCQIIIKNNEEKQKKKKSKKRFCKECKIYQLVRMKHCKQCKICIHKFDHHCFCGCVGEQNHGKFWIFLLIQSILNLYAFLIVNNKIQYKNFIQKGFDGLNYYEYQTIKIDKEKKTKQIQYSSEYGAYIITVILGVGFSLFTILLFIYHTFLISTNQTTWEHMRSDKITYLQNYPHGFLPFNQGIIKNFKETLNPEQPFKQLFQLFLQKYQKKLEII